MREFLDVAVEMTAHSETLDDLHMQIARGEKIVSLVFSVGFFCVLSISTEQRRHKI